MAQYLKSENNLSDLQSIDCALKNIGLGTMSTQSSNYVHITGGTISVDELVYKPATLSTDPSEIALLRVNQNNVVECLNVSDNWFFRPQNEIDVTKFAESTSDDRFVRLNEIKKVARTGKYADLVNSTSVPGTNLINDVDYLQRSSNLSDIPNILAARNSLGIGNLGSSNWNSVMVLDQLSVGSLYLDIQNSEKDAATLLAVQDNKLIPYTISKATDSTYGLVKLTDTIFSRENDVNCVPTIRAMNNYYNLTMNKIESMDVNNLIDSFTVDDIIQHYGLLRKSRNFDEIPISQLYANLNLGTLSMINEGDDVVLKNITLDTDSTIKFIDHMDNKTGYLMVDELGQLTKSTAKPLATAARPGMVYLMSNYNIEYALGDISPAMSKFRYDVVPSAQTVNEFFEIYDTQVHNLESSIPKTIKDVPGFENFMLIEDNMQVHNPSIARTNLGLSAVAHTGSWDDIIEKPVNISYFNNDKNYLTKENYLSELSDNPTSARKNLGLGDLATVDSNAVQFLGGSGTFNNLKITEMFQYKKGNENQGKVMTCVNPQGEGSWVHLPIATQSQLGIVRVTSDFNDNDHTKAVSSAMMFRMYIELTTRLNIYSELITTFANL
tara:strand:- start:329 stop:2158 length:1830 start_codon:yes stop_codon:yes gene_type:complete